MNSEAREKHRQSLMHDIYKLVNLIEADDNKDAVWLARSIHHDTQSYFDAERWQPQPVAEGAQALLPLEQPLIIVLHHHDYHSGGHEVIRGRLKAVRAPYKPKDGARLEVVPQRCRNPRTRYYHTSPQAYLTVYAGYLSDDELSSGKRTPIYHHESI